MRPLNDQTNPLQKVFERAKSETIFESDCLFIKYEFRDRQVRGVTPLGPRPILGTPRLPSLHES